MAAPPFLIDEAEQATPALRRHARSEFEMLDLQPEFADLCPGELQHSRLDASLAERELG
jgi:hypothetical protein